MIKLQTSYYFYRTARRWVVEHDASYYASSFTSSQFKAKTMFVGSEYEGGENRNYESNFYPLSGRTDTLWDYAA